MRRTWPVKKMKEISGCEGGVVNASGDLAAWGVNENNKTFSVQVADPKDIRRSLAWLTIDGSAVVTSGNYEKFFTNNGTRYAHIIDPKTGYPCTGIKSVTVIAPSAELADALATSVFVLGVQGGLTMINGLDGIECLLVDENDEMHFSKDLELNYY